MATDGTFDVLPKKEVSLLMKQRDKLERFLGGIEDMPKLPDVLFIVDPRKEQIAVHEAQKLNIPIVAMVDTNTDPDQIDVVIPSNDDAIRAVRLITSTMANAIIEGRQGEDEVNEDTFENGSKTDKKDSKEDSIEDIANAVEGKSDTDNK